MRLLFLTLFYLPVHAYAHVKWFSRSSDSEMINISQLNTLNFWLLLVLSAVVIAIISWSDAWLEKRPQYKRLNNYLQSFSENADIVLRIFTGAALLLSWQANSMIAPELQTESAMVGWLQFFMALFLMFRKSTLITGVAMFGVYIYAINQYSFFHLLDYLIYPAIGYYFIVQAFDNKKVSQTKIPVLYIGLGFSLFWTALEKLFFPQWGIDILIQKPYLTMGLPKDFFLMAAAFVELSIAYLLIIGVLQRPLALAVTILFVITSAFFGKTEVIGHTILHGALIVFIILGPGTYYKPPIRIHQWPILKAAFGGTNFIFMLFILGYTYYTMGS